MKKEYKLAAFTFIVFALVTGFLVYRYETLLQKAKAGSSTFNTVEGGTPVTIKYKAPEIIALIKKSKEYLGDSVTIFENGEMTSSNGKFQGTLKAVTSSEDNMELVRTNMNQNHLPLQYNVYVLAATFYRQQYSSEFTNQSPSLQQ
jgi:hypothetical protein